MESQMLLNFLPLSPWLRRGEPLLAADGGLKGAEYGVLGVAIIFLLGLMGWIIKHFISVVLPKIHEGHQQAMASSQKEQAEVVKKMVETFSTEQRELRQLFRDEVKTERDTSEKLHRENIDVATRRHESVMQALKDDRHAIRGVEHAVTMHHETVNAVVNQTLTRRRVSQPPDVQDQQGGQQRGQ